MNELSFKRVFSAEEVFLADEVIVVDVSPSFKYADGLKTDEMDGKWLEVVDSEKYQRFKIKMPLDFMIPSNSRIVVSDFKGFAGKLYCRHNKIIWTLKAYGIH